MSARSMPKASSRTLAIGTTQFVVQDAFEIRWWVVGSYSASLTPRTMVMSSPLAGALMTTFSAPASRCFEALSRSVNSPVDSTTTSAPSSFHGRAAGSRSAMTFSSSPSTVIPFSLTPMSASSVPRTESYFSRWARVLASVMSFTPTKSRFAPCSLAARKKFRPIRPNPLMPTFTVMFVASLVVSRSILPMGAGRPRSPQAAVHALGQRQRGFGAGPAHRPAERHRSHQVARPPHVAGRLVVRHQQVPAVPLLAEARGRDLLRGGRVPAHRQESEVGHQLRGRCRVAHPHNGRRGGSPPAGERAPVPLLEPPLEAIRERREGREPLAGGEHPPGRGGWPPPRPRPPPRDPV